MRANSIKKNFLFCLLASLGVYCPLSIAALPTPEAPSRGESGGILKMIQDYGYDVAVLAGLGLATIAFIVVAIVCIGKFHEVSVKKSTWSEFFTFVAIGAVILVIVIWLANKAAEIL